MKVLFQIFLLYDVRAAQTSQCSEPSFFCPAGLGERAELRAAMQLQVRRQQRSGGHCVGALGGQGCLQHLIFTLLIFLFFPQDFFFFSSQLVASRPCSLRCLNGLVSAQGFSGGCGVVCQIIRTLEDFCEVRDPCTGRARKASATLELKSARETTEKL